MNNIIQFPKETTQPVDDFADRVTRVKESVQRINRLMAELREMT